MNTRDIRIRELTLSDDLNRVARLLYLSNPNIFTTLFKSEEQAVKVIVEMLKLDDIYYYENIMVAYVGGRIVGLAVLMRKFPGENYFNFVLSFRNANCPISSNFEWVNSEYFASLNFDIKEPNIINLVIDPSYRKKGIATKLLNSLDKTEPYSISAEKGNEVAIHLFEKCGFKYIYEFPGFKKVPYVGYFREKKGSK